MKNRITMVLGKAWLAVTAFTAVPQPAAAITGGNASPAPYSFMGSLQRLDSPRDDLHVCGAALIAPTWALTAGHCARSAADILGKPTSGHPRHWQVRFGSLNVASGGELVDVAQFVQLNNRYFDRDLALLRLARPVQAAPISIADATPPAGTPARILGWGQACADASRARCLPQRLREADTQLRPGRTCGASAGLMCVGSLNGRVGPANMDSGGPALVMDDGRWTLLGSVEGGGGDEPAVYTNVTAYRGWIDRHVSGRTPIPADTPFPSRSLGGTVKLGGCSGALVRSARSRPSDAAMVLTNGHCAEPRPGRGQAVVDRPDQQLALILDENGEPLVRAYTTKLIYATITGTDVAVYRLGTTYQQLATDGVRAFTLATLGPRPGQKLRVLSGMSGRDWTCTAQVIVTTLREAGYTQRNAIRYRSRSGCGPGHGDSGSPLVDVTTGEIVGVHSTSSDNGRRCMVNNPCEVSPRGGVLSVKGRKYGQQTALLSRCLTSGSKLDRATSCGP